MKKKVRRVSKEFRAWLAVYQPKVNAIDEIEDGRHRLTACPRQSANKDIMLDVGQSEGRVCELLLN